MEKSPGEVLVPPIECDHRKSARSIFPGISPQFDDYQKGAEKQAADVEIGPGFAGGEQEADGEHKAAIACSSHGRFVNGLFTM